MDELSKYILLKFEKINYFASLLKIKNIQFNTLRRMALNGIKTNNFLDKKNKNWKHVNFNLFKDFNFLIKNNIENIKNSDAVNKIIKNIKDNNFIVLLNGEVIFTKFDRYFPFFYNFKSDNLKILNYYFSANFNLKNNFFYLLNAAIFQDCVSLHIPKNIKKAKIHIINISEAKKFKTGFCSKILIKVDSNSNLDLLETNIGLPGKAYLSNLVCEIFLEKDSKINHIRYIKENENSSHFGSIIVNQSENSIYNLNQLSNFGKFICNEINVKLLEKNACCSIENLDLATDNQLISNNILVEHYAKNCKSKQLVNGVYDNKSSGVFHGIIFVANKAIGTKATQINNNLLLSNSSSSSSRPEFQINIDDVECSHGSTTGQLDEDAIFFLCSRGISKNNAKLMLIEAFILNLFKIFQKIYKLDFKDCIKNNFGEFNE